MPDAADAILSEVEFPMASTELYKGSLTRLAALFHASLDELGSFEKIPVADLPTDAETLLAHNDHMTVTLEAFYNSLVDVHVLAELDDPPSYARESVLTRQSDGHVVQLGIMRIWFDVLPEVVRDEIRRQEYPLGRVLIRHNLLRDVELTMLWRIEPAEFMQQHLRVPAGTTLYGRTAQIVVEERPTVELLEVVRI